MTPSIAFFVPSPDLVARVPASIDGYWPWIHQAVSQAPASLPDGAGPCTWLGPYNWTIQTFLYLKDVFECRLTASLPDEGIVIAHGDFLPAALRPTRGRYVVEIKPDRALRCAYANFVIVQNPRDPVRSGIERALLRSAAVSYWPQPGLVFRCPNRGDRFENVCFMGNADQFMPGADALETELAKRGLRWTMKPRERWHDYSDADVVVALRRPLSAVPKERDPFAFSLARKPASKLTNAWLAGAPAVLSPDVAFRDLRRSDLDYLEARTIDEALRHIDTLRHSPALRRSMVENGRLRAVEFTPAAIVRQWTPLIATRIAPQYEHWTRSGVRRTALRFSRPLARAIGAMP